MTLCRKLRKPNRRPSRCSSLQHNLGNRWQRQPWQCPGGVLAVGTQCIQQA